jgi:hypothetical protein
MAEPPPLPDLLGLPSAAVVAVPANGLEVFRLVRSDPPTTADFQPSRYQRRRNIPELLRVGLSHYLTAEAAAAYLRQPGSQVARVTLSTGLPAHVARTFSRTNPLHVTVWARADLLVAHASVVRGGAEGLP